MNENCLDCINFKNEKCTLRPGECINYNHFRWTSLVQISQNDLETKYVSRISFDDMKSRAEKAEREADEWREMTDELVEFSYHISACNSQERRLIFPANLCNCGYTNAIKKYNALSLRYPHAPSETKGTEE